VAQVVGEDRRRSSARAAALDDVAVEVEREIELREQVLDLACAQVRLVVDDAGGVEPREAQQHLVEH